jgi:hypothetical protein
MDVSAAIDLAMDHLEWAAEERGRLIASHDGAKAAKAAMADRIVASARAVISDRIHKLAKERDRPRGRMSWPVSQWQTC